MRSRDRLYFPLERIYRPRATQPQVVLALVAIVLSLGVTAGHYWSVLRPSQTWDPALALPRYEPWYLRHQETEVARPVSTEKRSQAPTRARGTLEAIPQAQVSGSNRPRLVPEVGVTYSPYRIEDRLADYLLGRRAGPTRQDLADKARELAAAYAAGRASGLTAFPLALELERSVLERGWLWDLREGCEPQIYAKFPPGQVEAMGCGLASIPVGRPFGVGVAFMEKEGVAPRPVIAIVWENK